MSVPRTRPETPDGLPAEWYCRECDAVLPGSAFRPMRVKRRDGSIFYSFRHLCRVHWNVFQARYAQQRNDRKKKKAHAAAMTREEQAARQARFVAAIHQYVAGLWEQTPDWLLAPQRSPEQVEARALVVVILHDEHGIGITAASRAIGRDHSTALHARTKYRDQPLFAEMVADYRQWRGQRKAAHAATRAQRAG